MEWGAQQEVALRKVSDWLADPNGPQLFRLFGYAGTGKTTLARHLAEGINGDVHYAAFTGKAALVMRKNGCVGACTIHSLIYQPYESSEAVERIQYLKERIAAWDDSSEEGLALLRKFRKELDELTESIRSPHKPKPSFMLRAVSPLQTAKLLVVDEASMVDEEMAHDLMSFGVRILVLGDPAQLPPVKGEGFFTNTRPDVMLTDIRRQARDNPIIDLATRVREGGTLAYGQYGTSSVITPRELNPEAVLAADQVIVGYNKTRVAYNARIRALKGYTAPWPLAGEKLICLANDKDLGLLNGSLWDQLKDAEDNGDRKFTLRDIRSQDDGRVIEDVLVHAHHFTGEEVKLAFWEWREANEFTYGYAVTCHKSQGSQWGKVMVFDESRVAREHHKNWLYTAITRAQEELTIVR